MENLRLRTGAAVITGALTGTPSFQFLDSCSKTRINTDPIHILETASSIALAFAEHGCEQIYLGDSSLGGLEASRNAIKKRYPSVQVQIQAFDRSNEESVDEFISNAADYLKRIDYAVNVVSQAQESDLPKEHSIEGFDRNFHIYQRGV